jgi:DNA-binding GntR family transcriptional regulator
MESSGPDNGTAAATRDSGMTEPHPPSVFLGQFAVERVPFLPASKSTAAPHPGDPPRAQARDATRRAQPGARRGVRGGTEASDLQATPLREGAYNHLRTLILSGRIAPGQRLAEEHLAREFGISRAPIREALHKLESEGLITPLSRRGFAAFRDSQMEKEELVDLRAVLEGYALRVICGRLTEVQLQRLDTTVRKTEDALRSQRLGEISRWNTRFHDTLHELISDRRRLHHQLVTMRRYAFRYGENAQPESDAGRRTVEGHRRILTALRLRDPDLCERTMREHIHGSRHDSLRAEPKPLHRPAAGNRLDRGADTTGRP